MPATPLLGTTEGRAMRPLAFLGPIRAQSADDALRPQAAKALMFLRPERALCPERPQHFRKVGGAIGPPIGGRVAYRRRLTLLALDYRRLWQRR